MPRKYGTRPCRLCGRPATKPRCPACETKIRRYRCKQAAVKLKGGKCSRCGWVGALAGFEFHHLDPSKKEFGVGKLAQKSWKVIKKELEKCILLCANCHRIEHAPGAKDPRFTEELARYKGTGKFG